jgi:two-component system, chemotaxis family, response regulator Rcp1
VSVEILLVEDSASDVALIKVTLRHSQVPHNVHVVRNGVEAIDFLHKSGKYADVPRPDIILLDLNLPKKNGREVLEEVKVDPELNTIPIVILTTSSDPEDILRSYQLHANCYLTKPVDLDQFTNTIEQINSFWLQTVRLPAKTV